MSSYVSQQIAFKALMSVNGNVDVTDAHSNCNCVIKSFFVTLRRKYIEDENH